MTDKRSTKTGLAVIALLSLAVGAAHAQEGAAFRPSLGVMSLSTLGSSGLLMPLLSEDVFATQFARMGDSRVTDGFANALPPGVPRPHFQDINVVAVGGLSIVKEIPLASGAAFVRLAGSGAWSFGSDKTPLDNTIRDQRVMIQGFYAPIPGLLVGLGVAYDHLFVRSDTTQDPFGSYSTQVRPAVGYQLYYAQQFSPYVGIAAKSELQKGDTTFRNNIFVAPGVPFRFGNSQGDNRYYFEGNLVGTISAQNTPWMIDGWVAHPTLTATFQRDRVQTVIDTLGNIAPGVGGTNEYYGLISPTLRIEKAQLPTPRLQIMPSLTLGYEHEYRDSLAIYLRERNYAVAGAGVGFTMFGQRVDVDYKIRQGLANNRRYQGVSVTSSLFF